MRNGCLAKDLPNGELDMNQLKSKHMPCRLISLDCFHMFAAPACPRVSLNLKEDAIIHCTAPGGLKRNYIPYS